MAARPNAQVKKPSGGGAKKSDVGVIGEDGVVVPEETGWTTTTTAGGLPLRRNAAGLAECFFGMTTKACVGEGCCKTAARSSITESREAEAGFAAVVPVLIIIVIAVVVVAAALRFADIFSFGSDGGDGDGVDG